MNRIIDYGIQKIKKKKYPLTQDGSIQRAHYNINRTKIMENKKEDREERYVDYSDSYKYILRMSQDAVSSYLPRVPGPGVVAAAARLDIDPEESRMYFENHQASEGDTYRVEHLGVGTFSYTEEKRTINKDNGKEYRKKYYAERREEVRNNLLRAKGTEPSEIALQNGHENMPQVHVQVPRSNVGTSTPTKKRPRGKRLFDSDGLILLYCKSCNKSKPKINYQKETKCKYCEGDLKFQCIKCDLIYKSHMACLSHIKFKHSDANRS